MSGVENLILEKIFTKLYGEATKPADIGTNMEIYLNLLPGMPSTDTAGKQELRSLVKIIIGFTKKNSKYLTSLKLTKILNTPDALASAIVNYDGTAKTNADRKAELEVVIQTIKIMFSRLRRGLNTPPTPAELPGEIARLGNAPEEKADGGQNVAPLLEPELELLTNIPMRGTLPRRANVQPPPVRQPVPVIQPAQITAVTGAIPIGTQFQVSGALGVEQQAGQYAPPADWKDGEPPAGVDNVRLPVGATNADQPIGTIVAEPSAQAPKPLRSQPPLQPAGQTLEEKSANAYSQDRQINIDIDQRVQNNEMRPDDLELFEERGNVVSRMLEALSAGEAPEEKQLSAAGVANLITTGSNPPVAQGFRQLRRMAKTENEKAALNMAQRGLERVIRTQPAGSSERIGLERVAAAVVGIMNANPARNLLLSVALPTLLTAINNRVLNGKTMTFDASRDRNIIGLLGAIGYATGANIKDWLEGKIDTPEPEEKKQDEPDDPGDEPEEPEEAEGPEAKGLDPEDLEAQEIPIEGKQGIPATPSDFYSRDIMRKLRKIPEIRHYIGGPGTYATIYAILWSYLNGGPMPDAPPEVIDAVKLAAEKYKNDFIEDFEVGEEEDMDAPEGQEQAQRPARGNAQGVPSNAPTNRPRQASGVPTNRPRQASGVPTNRPRQAQRQTAFTTKPIIPSMTPADLRALQEQTSSDLLKFRDGDQEGGINQLRPEFNLLGTDYGRMTMPEARRDRFKYSTFNQVRNERSELVKQNAQWDNDTRYANNRSVGRQQFVDMMPEQRIYPTMRPPEYYPYQSFQQLEETTDAEFSRQSLQMAQRYGGSGRMRQPLYPPMQNIYDGGWANYHPTQQVAGPTLPYNYPTSIFNMDMRAFERTDYIRTPIEGTNRGGMPQPKLKKSVYAQLEELRMRGLY